MLTFKVNKPDTQSYWNRAEMFCPVCHKKFMSGADGLEIVSKIGYLWVCSDDCVTFYILASPEETDANQNWM